MIKKPSTTKLALFAGAAALAALTGSSHAQSRSDILINKLEQKGILTTQEASELRTEMAEAETNLLSELPASKWKLPDSIKDIQLFGDLRVRYERRALQNPTPKYRVGFPTSGATGESYARERFRYAFRLGLKGDLYDDFNYGLRLETSANPRSPWVTFADDTGKSSSSPLSGTPSDKSNDGIYIGQAYIGWQPTSWYEMTVGRMPQPLYTTPMVWDSDINPEGAFEKFKGSIGPVDFFADFGQFDYQNPSVAQQAPSSDTFLLAWQAGALVHFGKDMFVKVAPVLYNYIGRGNGPGLGVAPTSAAVLNSIYAPFVGQGDYTGQLNGTGFNGFYNQSGIDNLCVLEIPAEFDFNIYHTPLGTLHARIFGDFAYNYEGNDRSRAAFKAGGTAAFPGVKKPILDQNTAYQFGVGIGTAGPTYGPTQGVVYGSASKKHTWEARFYWQCIEQYALDVNLLDSDFFEGRGNLQGCYASFAYSFTDAIIGTIRYGYANQINRKLGTGGSNLDIPSINPVRNFDLVQADLTWRF